MLIILLQVLCYSLRVLAVDNPEFAGRITSVAEALIDPQSSYKAYPNVRQARENAFGSVASILQGGSASSIFTGMLSGLTGLLDKFSSSVGGPRMPAAMSKALDQMKNAPPDSPTDGTNGTVNTAPRMTKPTRADFEREFRRRMKIKGQKGDIEQFIPPGVRRKRQTKSELIKKAHAQRTQEEPKTVTSNGMNLILITVLDMFKGLGSIFRTPADRVAEKLKDQREKFGMIVSNVEEAPNTIFGMLRSKREVREKTESDKDSANDLQVTATELAIAHQRNWFTFFRSYNYTLECSEWEFCRLAKQNNELSSASAKSGGKFLSYVVSGVRDRHGRTGQRLTQAVDCCLSDDLAQAEQCENFYQNQCLEVDPSYVLAKD